MGHPIWREKNGLCNLENSARWPREEGLGAANSIVHKVLSREQQNQNSKSQLGVAETLESNRQGFG